MRGGKMSKGQAAAISNAAYNKSGKKGRHRRKNKRKRH